MTQTSEKQRYRVTFERVDRRTDVDPIEIEVATADEAARQVHEHIRRSKLLASRWFQVTVDDEYSTGLIDGGRFGRFDVEPVDG